MCVSREMLPTFLKGENAKNIGSTVVRSRNTHCEQIFSIRNDIFCLLCIINISMTTFAIRIPLSFHILSLESQSKYNFLHILHIRSRQHSKGLTNVFKCCMLKYFLDPLKKVSVMRGITYLTSWIFVSMVISSLS